MTRTGRVPPAYLTLFASLYAVQGVVYAYLINFNIGYMTGEGVPEPRAQQVQSLALVPFILKFLCAPVSDRINLLGLGHRKPYILIGLALQGVGLLGLSAVNPAGALGTFTALAVLAVSGLALYDTCCDGMVIDVTPADDRSRVQGILMASRFLAATVCSQAFGSWLDWRLGRSAEPYHELLWACAGLGLLPLSLGLALREPNRREAAEAFDWRALGVLVRPRSLALLAFGTLYAVVGLGVEQNLRSYYAITLGIGPGGVGSLGAIRNVGRALGGALLAVLGRKLGRTAMLLTAIAGMALSTAGQAGAHGFLSAGAWGLLFGMANGWSDALFFVLAMEASDPRMAASTYALFMAVTNISVLGGGLESAAVEHFGSYRPAFLVSGLLVLGNLLWVPVLRRPLAPPEARDDPAAL